MTEKIGHNSEKFDDQVEANRNGSTLLWNYHTILQALRDPRLSNRHRSLLSAICSLMDLGSFKSQPTYDELHAQTGLTKSGIDRALKDLHRWGYIIANSGVPIGKREFTVSKLQQKHIEKLQCAITDYLFKLHGKGEKAHVKYPDKFDEKGRPYFTQKGNTVLPPGEDRSSLEKGTPYFTPSEHRSSPGTVENEPKKTGDTLYKKKENLSSKDCADKADADSRTQPDLLDEDDPPPEVVVKIRKNYVSMKRPEDTKAHTLSNQWIERNGPKGEPLDLLKEFVAGQVEAYFVDPDAAKAGRVMGYIQSGFNFRYADWKRRRTEGVKPSEIGRQSARFGAGGEKPLPEGLTYPKKWASWEPAAKRAWYENKRDEGWDV